MLLRPIYCSFPDDERNWPMLFLIRNGLAIVRWLLHVGMLMLIMLLLFMDTPERRPFVQSLVLGVVAEVRSRWDTDGMPDDPGAHPAAEPSKSESGNVAPAKASEPSSGDRRDDGSEFPMQ
jgi:hypothetical protein